jgi:hypothetical protein
MTMPLNQLSRSYSTRAEKLFKNIAAPTTRPAADSFGDTLTDQTMAPGPRSTPDKGDLADVACVA